MTRKLFLFLTFLILIFDLVLRLVPLKDNNFYFTMDQGNDALHVREILNQHQLPLRGTETGGIPGLFTGPAWYWLIFIGLLFSQNHPVGPLIFIILVNFISTFLVGFYLFKRTNAHTSLLVILSLQFLWAYYDTTRYAFNPFLLVPLSFGFILSMKESIKKEKFIYLSVICVGLAFHFEIASAIPWLIYLILYIFYLYLKKRLDFKNLIYSILILFLFAIPSLIYEVNNHFSQTTALFHHLTSNNSVVSKTQYLYMFKIFQQILGEGLIPTASFLVNLLLIVITLTLSFKNYLGNKGSYSYFALRFFVHILALTLISYVWFGATTGWQTWHTVYLPPLIFTSFILTNLQYNKKIGLLLVAVVVITQLSFFQKEYRHYLTPSDDPSLLHNEQMVIDWVYAHGENQGFSVYTRVPSIYDYHYQYLYWWYGKNKYGYLPCEFNTYPKSPKTYLPNNFQSYEKPIGQCPSKVRILVIEKDKNNAYDQIWYQDITKNTTLQDRFEFNKLILEKRILTK